MFGVDGKGKYNTAKVLSHLKLECTGGGKDCPEILDLVTKETASKKAEDKTFVQESLGLSCCWRPKIGSQRYQNRDLCAQAHLFLYSNSSVTVSIFNDPLFNEMPKAMIPLIYKVDKPPLLNSFGAL